VECPVVTTKRRFTLLDAMVLVAATSVGLSIVRAAPFKLFSIAQLILVSWTVAVVLLGLSRTRPWLRGRFGSPGMAACGAACLAMGIFIAVTLAFHLARQDPAWWLLPLPVRNVCRGVELWISMSAAAWPALGVVLTWFVFRKPSGWPNEPDWHDRLGRILGVIWIGFAMFSR
jgi:hypothetical protein